MTEHDENAAILAQNNTEKHRYELVDTGAEGRPVVGETYYVGHGEDERIFYHTVVDESYGGRGLAGMLAKFALDATVEAGLKIVPVCPYIKKYVTRHKDEFGEHVVSVKPAHLDALK
ncbi:GNAT family N-acetyltransferase [Zhihengliuella salsuginis]|uniref:N-acetyltransferase n=1 Tax=Zhihengliuella salsuginis TaxID=578222 RepID=A0ABQ3GEM1_9MICC|nr:GNAT family N-acetyltransferase [Zhihengliuella salsuginis]GHD02376.1 N-acetyltransferase [Zhihengliuella salsuginis]